MKTIDSKLLQLFIKTASETLDGEWIIIGGSLLPLLGLDLRSTSDIDFIGKTSEEQKQSLKLMEIAEKLDLPIESINQAGAFFLNRIKGFEKELILFHQHKQTKIYRPSLLLYLKLKIKRLSESDLTDCQAYHQEALKLGDNIQKSEIIKIIQSEIKSSKSEERSTRLEHLLKLTK